MKALIVDGLNLVRRIYAGIPEHDNNHINDDRINQVIRSSRSSLNRALKFHKPSHCILVFENQGKTWRHDLLPDYKKTRPPMPDDLKQGMPKIIESFQEIGLQSFSLDGYEADDVIATISTKIAENQGHSIILSTDRIHCQLLNDNIQVFDHFAGQYLDHETIEKKYQVPQKFIADVLALAGDSGLSIPGIESVGIKTAAKLINQYGNIQSIFSNMEDISDKLASKLKNGEATVRTGLQLFTLKKDLSLGINLNQFRYEVRQYASRQTDS